MVNALLDWFERNKLGVIGTLVLHTAILFVLTILSIPTALREDQRNEMRMDVISSEEAEEMIERIEAGDEYVSQQVTNLSSNITAELSKPSFSSERLAQRVENDLRSMEQAEFERLAEERRERGEEIEIPQLDPSKWDKELYMDKAVEPVKVEGATTVWHDLKDRAERYIHAPAYVCRGIGLVVVQVEVDREGNVRKAAIDATRTNTPDECMLDHALLSAQRARFHPLSQAQDRQSGAIYYRFLPQ